MGNDEGVVVLGFNQHFNVSVFIVIKASCIVAVAVVSAHAAIEHIVKAVPSGVGCGGAFGIDLQSAVNDAVAVSAEVEHILGVPFAGANDGGFGGGLLPYYRHNVIQPFVVHGTCGALVGIISQKLDSQFLNLGDVEVLCRRPSGHRNGNMVPFVCFKGHGLKAGYIKVAELIVPGV